MRAIGALYMRLVGKALDVYQYLEPLLNDYRKLRLITGNEMASHTKRDLRRAPCLPRHRARASRAPTTAVPRAPAAGGGGGKGGECLRLEIENADVTCFFHLKIGLK